MITGIYQSAAGMLSLGKMQEVLANNLANVTTNGFKKELLEVVQTGIAQQTTESHLNMHTGALQVTNNPLQLALASEGFFTVHTPAGTAFTRNGDFQLTADGRLVTADGYAVQGQTGEIVLDNSDFTVGESGEIVVNGKVLDKLQISQGEGPLRRLGNNLMVFEDPESVSPLETSEVQVMQGFVESSNVNIVESMVDMITITRLYETNQKILQDQDSIMRQAVTEIGRASR